jgi:hypothetical protein
MNAEPYSYADAQWGRRILFGLAILIFIKEAAVGACAFLAGLHLDPLWLPVDHASGVFANKGALTLAGKFVFLLLALQRNVAGRWGLGILYLASASCGVSEVVRSGVPLSALPLEAELRLGNGGLGLVFGATLLILKELRANEVIFGRGGTTVPISPGDAAAADTGGGFAKRLRAFIQGLLAWAPVLAMLAGLAYVNGLTAMLQRALAPLLGH